MGTVNAILLFVEPYITWVNETFSWAASKCAAQPGPASQRSVSFLLPGGVLICRCPVDLGVHEVRS